MIHYIAKAMAAIPALEYIAVTGHESKDIEAVLAEYPFRFVFNPKYETGMTSSIQAGVKILSENSEGIMIALSDLPKIQAADLEGILKAFMNAKKKMKAPILVPVFEGRKGHPIVFDIAYREALLLHQEPDGCKGILKANPDALVFYPMEDKRIFADIDRPEDYEALLNEED